MNMLTLILLFVLISGMCVESSTLYTATLNILYPSSNLPLNGKIYLRGDAFNLNWNEGVLMTPSPHQPDTWTLTLSQTRPSSTPFTFNYKVLVNDRTWQIGANSMIFFQTNPIANVTTYPWFFTTQGEYLYTRNVHSPQLSNFRDVVTYLPPSYRENIYKTYSKILLMTDGENVFNASTSFGGIAWNVQNTVNEQVYAGNMDEIVVIAVDNSPIRIYEYDSTLDLGIVDGGGANLYLDFVENTVIPLMKSIYPRIESDVHSFGMAGSSLGGILTCFAGWTRGAFYEKCACMSSSFWWNDFDFNTTILFQDGDGQVRPKMIYVDVGALEPYASQIVGAEAVADHLESIGYVYNDNLKFYLDPIGSHNEASWGRRFYIPMQFLYPPEPVVV